MTLNLDYILPEIAKTLSVQEPCELVEFQERQREKWMRVWVKLSKLDFNVSTAFNAVDWILHKIQADSCRIWTDDDGIVNVIFLWSWFRA
jgi:hypothetical protein